RLLVRVAHVAAALLGARAQARVRLVGDHDLVHQRLVVVAPEQRVRRGDRGGLALVVDQLEVHQAPFAADFGVLAAGRTTMSRPRLPGTEPFTMISWRSASMRTISRFCAVRLTLPRCPAMRLPGNTRPGSCAWPVEPGLLCEIELPWLARLDEKWWRLITPAKPLPCETPDTSTI